VFVALSHWLSCMGIVLSSCPVLISVLGQRLRDRRGHDEKQFSSGEARLSIHILFGLLMDRLLQSYWNRCRREGNRFSGIV
jgi:hypothetical protein